MLKRLFVRWLSLWIALSPIGARATQNELIPPTAGVYTAVQYSQLVGDAFRSLASCNKGPTAPANVSSAAVDGLCWIDDSGSIWLKKRYANGAWITEGGIDPTNGYWVGGLGGGSAALLSGATVDLGSVPQANISVTGTTDISSFGSSAPEGTVKVIRFADVLWLVNSANLAAPGGFSIKTAANDRAIVTSLGSGAWEITQYTRANGVPVDASLLAKPQFTMGSPISGIEVYGAGQALTRTSYPAYLAKVSRAQNGTRTSGNATIASVADTSGMGLGMPAEGTGIAAGCTISSLVANTSITLNSSACVTSSGTSPVTVLFTGYGSGGDNTTVGVPDCQGRVIAGRDDASGTAAARITSAGSSVNGLARNASGGAQTVSVLQANLPSINFPVTGNVTSSAPVKGSTVNTILDGGSTVHSNVMIDTGGTTSFSIAGGAVAASGGSGTSLNKMPPVLIADCVVRVVP